MTVSDNCPTQSLSSVTIPPSWGLSVLSSADKLAARSGISDLQFAKPRSWPPACRGFLCSDVDVNSIGAAQHLDATGELRGPGRWGSAGAFYSASLSADIGSSSSHKFRPFESG